MEYEKVISAINKGMYETIARDIDTTAPLEPTENPEITNPDLSILGTILAAIIAVKNGILNIPDLILQGIDNIFSWGKDLLFIRF